MSARQREHWRLRWARALDPELRRARGLSPVNQVIVAIILVSVVIGILDTEPELHRDWAGWFRALEAVFLVVFVVEYIARAAVATVNPRHPTVLAYLLTPAALFDLAVIVGVLLPFFGLEANLLRLVRAFRLIRLARLGRFSVAIRLIGTAISSRGPEIAVSLIFAGVLLLVSSTGLYLVEGPVQPEAFGSIPRAMWWSVATLTTVGYGDVVPVTGLGRILAALTAFTGIAVIAIPTGLIAAAFAEAIRAARAHHPQHAGGEGPAAPPPSPPPSPPASSPPPPAQERPPHEPPAPPPAGEPPRSG